MEANNNPYLPAMTYEIPWQFRLKAEKELGETEESKRHGLAKLRDFLKRENYPPNDDDTFLLQFLRQQKFNYKKAEAKLKRHYYMREKTVQLYQSMDEDIFREIIDTHVLSLLPLRDAEGRTLIFNRGISVDLSKYDASDVLKCALALLQFVSTFPLTSICGISVITEARHRKSIDALYVFNESRKFIWIENSCPFRLQKMDFFDEDAFFHYLWMGLRPFLPSKFTERVLLHGNHKENLLRTYDSSILPEECGGKLGPVSSDGFRDEFLRYVQKLRAECYLYQRLG